MGDQDVKIIREKLEIILVTQGIQKEATKGIQKNIENIDKHLEKQNGNISKSEKKLATHDVWIKIVSVIVLAVLVAVVTAALKL